ncbi:hypothetical protein K1719_006283 [Acacia pycnantha]|nr:hypothetical protein K1719_006283 [Acacia pycnantha]
MKAGNEEVGPKIDLQLGLNYSNQCILKTGGLGAGANAVSKLGMRFVANSPLSELVWSPGKGLSLKYVDSRDDEEIQESVESCCNSSGQFSTGKRLNFQQDLMLLHELDMFDEPFCWNFSLWYTSKKALV